jgi:hypothetical protein
MMQTSITSYKIDLRSLYDYDIQHMSSIARSAKYLIFKNHKYKKNSVLKIETHSLIAETNMMI